MNFILQLPSLFPPWFFAVSAGIEILCAIIGLIIFVTAYRSYLYLKDNKLVYLSLGFLLISLSLFSHALLNLAINFNLLGAILGAAEAMGIKSLFVIYYLLLIGVVLAYMSFIVIYSKTTRLGTVLLFYLLTLIIGALLFKSYVGINLFSAMLSGIVVFYTGNNYMKNRKNKKGTNCFLIFGAFASITLFHLMFVLEHFHGMFYNIKYLVLALGFMLFLAAMLRVYYGRKKK